MFEFLVEDGVYKLLVNSKTSREIPGLLARFFGEQLQDLKSVVPSATMLACGEL